MRAARPRRRCRDPAPAGESPRRCDEADPTSPGEPPTVIGGVTVPARRHVRLRPAAGSNAQDHLLDGRSATIERIYLDYDDKRPPRRHGRRRPRPGLMRDIGRFLFFMPTEVEVIETA